MMKKIFRKYICRILAVAFAAATAAAMMLSPYAANVDDTAAIVDTADTTGAASDTAGGAGEVLGVMEDGGSAVVGIVVAILIAIAVIVLILALIPRGSAG